LKDTHYGRAVDGWPIDTAKNVLKLLSLAPCDHTKSDRSARFWARQRRGPSPYPKASRHEAAMVYRSLISTLGLDRGLPGLSAPIETAPQKWENPMSLVNGLFRTITACAIFWSLSATFSFAQDTLTFTSSPNTPTVSDGDAGSSNLAWINLTLSSDTSNNWTLENPYGGFSALFQGYNVSAYQSTVTLQSSSTAVNFWLKGFVLLIREVL
jgi:hypothetical protein